MCRFILLVHMATLIATEKLLLVWHDSKSAVRRPSCDEMAVMQDMQLLLDAHGIQDNVVMSLGVRTAHAGLVAVDRTTHLQQTMEAWSVNFGKDRSAFILLN